MKRLFKAKKGKREENKSVYEKYNQKLKWIMHISLKNMQNNIKALIVYEKSITLLLLLLWSIFKHHECKTW